jgi:hypothetical protein
MRDLLSFPHNKAGGLEPLVRGCSAVGSASRSHREGQGFDSPQLHRTRGELCSRNARTGSSRCVSCGGRAPAGPRGAVAAFRWLPASVVVPGLLMDQRFVGVRVVKCWAHSAMFRFCRSVIVLGERLPQAPYGAVVAFRRLPRLRRRSLVGHFPAIRGVHAASSRTSMRALSAFLQVGLSFHVQRRVWEGVTP